MGKLESFVAKMLVYVPFTMGGSVWQPRQYVVEGEAVKFGKEQRDGFVWLRNGRYRLHDKESGHFICDGGDIPAAVKRATELVNITPDFAKQAASMAGTAETITFEVAMRYLDKADSKSQEVRKEHDKLLRAERKKHAAGNDRGRNKGRKKGSQGVERAHG